MVDLLNLARMTVASAPGTGASVALDLAVPGYLTFALAGAVDGKTYRYGIRDGVNRELSSGVYTASTKTFSRTVLKSTNGDAAINATINAIVAGVVAAEDVTARRELLTADRTYFVRTDGNDNNTGLVNTSGGAFLTIAKAIAVATALDLGISSVTIQIGNATWTTPVVLKSYVGGGTITLKGDSTTPANVFIDTTGADAINLDSVRGKWIIDGFKLRTTTSGATLGCFNSKVDYKNINWGASAGTAHVYAAGFGTVVTLVGNDEITGSASSHVCLQSGASFSASVRTTTLTGTPAFTSGFFNIDLLSGIGTFGVTYTGAATGPRFSVTGNSILQTYGNTPPGSTAGTTGSGGLAL